MEFAGYTPRAACALAQLPCSLRALNLAFAGLGPREAALLAGTLDAQPGLTTLTLSRNSIGPTLREARTDGMHPDVLPCLSLRSQLQSQLNGQLHS